MRAMTLMHPAAGILDAVDRPVPSLDAGRYS